VLRRPELAADERYSSNERRLAARAVLDERIRGCFADQTAEQVIARLDEAQIANARLNTMQEVWSHPQLQARGRWTQVETPSGAVPALLPPGADTAAWPDMHAVPDVGEHSGRILEELGYSAAEVQRLREQKAV
jgi:itaconate CoA-transferase